MLGPGLKLVLCQVAGVHLFRICLNTAHDKRRETLPTSTQAATLFPWRHGAERSGSGHQGSKKGLPAGLGKAPLGAH